MGGEGSRDDSCLLNKTRTQTLHCLETIRLLSPVLITAGCILLFIAGHTVIILRNFILKVSNFKQIFLKSLIFIFLYFYFIVVIKSVGDQIFFFGAACNS
jgi:uncharacterized protein YybS (DUF2232 family)